MIMKFESIKSFNTYTNIRPPKIDLIDVGEYTKDFRLSSPPVLPGFYRISIKYGLENDRERGFMYFSSPNQPIEWNTEIPWKGYFINITQDFVSQNKHLDYSFLNYGLHEPLHLKDDEADSITQYFKESLKEFNKDDFSNDLLLAYINLIFAYVAEFYKRQFGERKDQNSRLVTEFFDLLKDYYNHGEKGLDITQPSVNYFASQLNVTPNYLSDVIKFHTGKPALEHIHGRIIQEAKVLLVQKESTISEIAYQLGFEYPNYFSRLFRKITGLSPSNFSNL